MTRFHSRGQVRIAATAVAAAMSILMAGCYGYSTPDRVTDRPTETIATCSNVFAAAMESERTGSENVGIDSQVAYLSENCPTEFDTFVGYTSALVTIRQFGSENCEVWESRVGYAATQLLWEDGHCELESEVSTEQPGGRLLWSQAVQHVGENQRVCGPLMSARTSYDDVFLNLGRDYPDPSRFTIVLWDIGGLEYIENGATLCAEGTVTSYEGVAQLELYDPALVEIWR